MWTIQNKLKYYIKDNKQALYQSWLLLSFLSFLTLVIMMTTTTPQCNYGNLNPWLLVSGISLIISLLRGLY